MQKRWIPRPGLQTVLEKALQRQVIVVVAPPGYGKTSSIRKAIASFDRPAIWFTCGDSKNRFAGFINTLYSQLDEMANNTTSHPPPEQIPEDCAIDFVKSVEETLPHGVFLVLDSLDQNPLKSEIRLFLKQILDSHPVSIHMILISAAEPHLDLTDPARSRQLVVIDEQCLAFTRLEIAEFLSSIWGKTAKPQLVDEVMELTLGWPQGLQALGFLFSSPPESLQELRSSTHLASFSPKEQTLCLPSLDRMERELLYSLSFLKTFSTEDVILLTGVPGAADHVEQIVQARPDFIPAESGRFIMNPVLRASLRAAVEREWSPRKIKEHKILVASILESRGELERSLRLYLENSDGNSAHRILTTLGSQWIMTSDPSVLTATT